MSRLTRNGTAEPVSRDKIFRRERGQHKTIIFLIQLTTSRVACQSHKTNPCSVGSSDHRTHLVSLVFLQCVQIVFITALSTFVRLITSCTSPRVHECRVHISIYHKIKILEEGFLGKHDIEGYLFRMVFEGVILLQSFQVSHVQRRRRTLFQHLHYFSSTKK